jgi:very-short-patch-repair endonuclease
MGYEDCRVGVEYDGAQHWTDPKRRAHDIERAVELTEHGWIIVRVSADILRYRPWVVVTRAVDALRAAGCPWLAECGVELRSARGRVA